MAETPIISTGSSDFSQGVDSIKTPTQAGADNPNGLTANQLAWLINGTVRDGSISPRDRWAYRGVTVGVSSLPYLLGSIFQGKTPYYPATGNPYEIHVVGGHILKVDPTGVLPPIDLSAVYGLSFPVPLAAKCYFVQAGAYLVIQSGDYNPQTGNGTLPLFWNGSVLIRSNGITGVTQVGLPIYNSYTVGTQFAWTVPAAVSPPFGPGASVTLTTTSQYGGNVGDKITIASSPVATPFTPSTVIGNFVVLGISFNELVIQTVSSGYVNTTLHTTDGPFVMTLEIPTTSASQAVNVLNALAVETSTGISGGNGVPPIGGSGIIFLSNNYLYPGSVGDIVEIFWGAGFLSLGTFLIEGIAPGALSIQTQSTSEQGHTVMGALRILPINNPYTNANYFLIPPIGQTASIPLDNQYIGSLGDTISIPGAGTFLVTNVGNFLEEGPLVIRAITPANVGTVFPTTFTLTVTDAPSSTGLLINQLPAATAMIYYSGRIFFGQSLLGQAVVNYGDIVGSLSGTAANNYLDSVLSVTQAPLVFGGGGFALPISGPITGFAVPQMINASLGQGLLNAATANGICAIQLPANQAEWISLTAANPPQIFVVQQSNGFANDWCVSSVNGDLWFQSYAADIRSLLTAVRYFQQWGNVSLSSNEDRILALVNAALLFFSSSIYFDNRLLNTTYPQQTPYGVVHPALIPLDLTTISTLEQQDPPNWEASWEGLQIFQLDTITFANSSRAFATVLSTTNPGEIQTWEFVQNQIGDIWPTGPVRIGWQAETCSFTWGDLFKLKELLGGELWIDEIQGVLDVEVEYKPDGSSCWFQWAAFSVCAETTANTTYPPIVLSPGTRKPLVLPKPPQACSGENSRPSSILYECQLRLTFLGEGRLRGLKLHAQVVKRPMYQGLIATVGSWIKSVGQFILEG
jgi:hypothetical protein